MRKHFHIPLPFFGLGRFCLFFTVTATVTGRYAPFGSLCVCTLALNGLRASWKTSLALMEIIKKNQVIYNYYNFVAAATAAALSSLRSWPRQYELGMRIAICVRVCVSLVSFSFLLLRIKIEFPVFWVDCA